MVPRSTNPNVIVSVRSVPTVNGVGLLAASPAARAIGAMIGTKRDISMTSPHATSQWKAYLAGGDGFALASANPCVSARPSMPEPLFADADVNSYSDSDSPCGPGLLADSADQPIAAN